MSTQAQARRSRTRILLVEDDRAAALLVARELGAAGLDVDVAEDGAAGLARAREQRHDLLILDLELPGLAGTEVLQELRQAGDEVPVLVLSARQRCHDVVGCLERGADDYLRKPFHSDELIARVHAVLRRREGAGTRPWSVGGLAIDRDAREARCGGTRLDLTPKEYQLLTALVGQSPRVVSRARLLEEVWDLHFDPGTNLLDVHVSRLRQKLHSAGCNTRIDTARGCGFRIVPPAV